MSLVRKNPKYLTSLSQIPELDEQERNRLYPVAQKFAFRTNEYYQSLINWDDPDDPIRRLVMPDVQELEDFGAWDASEEASYTVVQGLEHKYRDTALLLVNNICGAYCRFCFRKRLFTQENDETINDVSEAIKYIRVHPEINNIVLSGGDPLVMSTGKLERIIEQLAGIDHVRIIRIGSKMLSFNPFRVTGDPSLIDMVKRYRTPEKRIYLMVHFNHPRELTAESIHAIFLMQEAGAITFNQSPILRGVNDRPEVIAELFGRLSSLGVVPYYLFICRPTAGNKSFIVPVEEAISILDQARAKLSGVACSARLCMSHKSGKIEVVGKYGNQVILRRHRLPNSRQSEVLMFPCDPTAYWLDDYFAAQETTRLSALASA